MSAHQVRSYVPFVTADGTNDASPADRSGIPQYEIRVKGHLGSRWSAWFDGLSLTSEDDGTTVIRGPVPDQAALHGLLSKLRDVGIPLVSLAQVLPDATHEPSAHDTTEGN